MQRSKVVARGDGVHFGFLGDQVRIKLSGEETGGSYSVLEWEVAPGADSTIHAHNKCDETFYIASGSLTFVVGGVVTEVATGDFVRVVAGTRHGYTNRTSDPAMMVVTFSPGGMENVFLSHRTDEFGAPFDRPVYRSAAKDMHDTECGPFVRDWLDANEQAPQSSAG